MNPNGLVSNVKVGSISIDKNSWIHLFRYLLAFPVKEYYTPTRIPRGEACYDEEWPYVDQIQS
jgi:hypothetical protein